MLNIRQPGRAHPSWVRLVAFTALLFLLALTPLQAAHMHGDWLPHPEFQLTAHFESPDLPGSDANCPICIAMHAALAVAPHAHAEQAVSTHRIAATPQQALPPAEWQYTLFSRPPPAS